MRPQHDFTFYAELNPDRRLGIAHLYITISRFECKGPHVEESYSLLRAVDILEQLTNVVPGLVDGHLMLARAFLRMSNCEAAQRSIQSVLALDFGSSSAHLLLAQVNGCIVFSPTKSMSCEQGSDFHSFSCRNRSMWINQNTSWQSKASSKL